MAYKTIRGKILYTSLKEERKGAERGREYFSITQQRDGCKVVHAHCEIDDAPMVVRDVVLSLDPDNYPLDSHVRLTVGHQFEGSGWFRFGNDYAECETFNQRDGRISQRIELEQRIRWLGTHPILCDALGAACYDLSQGPGKTLFPSMALTSPDHRGATGPLLFRLGFGIEFVGRETIEVPAGTFKCLHFRYTDTGGQMPEEHPAYDVWCTEEDYILLAAQAGGYMQTRYDLVELSIE